MLSLLEPTIPDKPKNIKWLAASGTRYAKVVYTDAVLNATISDENKLKPKDTLFNVGYSKLSPDPVGASLNPSHCFLYKTETLVYPSDPAKAGLNKKGLK